MSITNIVKSDITAYDIKTQEIKKDDLVVRTNHGKLIKSAGFQPSDDDTKGWDSSVSRYEIAKKAVEGIKEPHPFEVLTTLKNLSNVVKDNNKNPIRLEQPKAKDGHKPYYSSTIVMLTPTGTMFAVPLDSEVDHKSRLVLKDGRKVDFVLLPKNLPLFESFRNITYKEKFNYFR